MTPLLLEMNGTRATLLPHRGALISSLRFGKNGHEVFWMAENFDASASSWPGGGLPFLFPFAGRVWHQGELYRYKVGQSIYHMPLHGFSWATRWSVLEHTNNQAILELHDDEKSCGIFPFKFRLRLTVTLNENALKSEIRVKHLDPLSDAEAMPVALGWHPYLRLYSGPSQLIIPARVIHPVTSQGGAGKPETTALSLGPSPWNLPHDRLQSLILSDLVSPKAQLRQGGEAPPLEITAGPAEAMCHMVTWTNEPHHFHCVEPWMSLPDAVATPTGCRWLRAGEWLDAWIQISM